MSVTPVKSPSPPKRAPPTLWPASRLAEYAWYAPCAAHASKPTATTTLATIKAVAALTPRAMAIATKPAMKSFAAMMITTTMATTVRIPTIAPAMNAPISLSVDRIGWS
jgi:hypothetical protein